MILFLLRVSENDYQKAIISDLLLSFDYRQSHIGMLTWPVSISVFGPELLLLLSVPWVSMPEHGVSVLEPTARIQAK